MAAASSECLSEFVFVDQSGSNVQQALQQNRRKIRQQARKHAVSQLRVDRLHTMDIRIIKNPGTTESDDPKRRASKCKNMRDNKADSREPHSAQTLTISGNGCQLSQLGPLPDLPAKGYELVRAQHRFDLAWLSALATNHPGRTPADSNPSTPPLNRTAAMEWLNFQANSYVDMIPAYYSESKLLRSVIDCTLAKAEHTLSPTTKTGQNALVTYGRALKNMQENLNDKRLVHKPETLAAMQLLQLYELLDVGEPETWVSHTAGIRKLIELRGPSKVVTELDISLVSTQIQYIYHYAFLNNGDCFLEQPEWQTFLTSIASTNRPGRHPLFLSMWATVVAVPRLFRQATEYLQNLNSEYDREDLLAQLRKLRSTLSQWRTNFFKSGCDKIFNKVFYNSLLSDGLANNCVVNRLIIALRPSDEDAYALESETQELAVMISKLRIERIVPAGYFVGLISKATKEEWLGVALNMQEKVNDVRDVIDVSIFQKWCAMMGRGGIYGSWPGTKGKA